MPTSTTKKVLAEFAWNDYQTPASVTKKVLAELAWSDYQIPESVTKKLLAEFAWGDFIPSTGGGGIDFPFTSPAWGQGDSIDGQDTLTLWGME